MKGRRRAEDGGGDGPHSGGAGDGSYYDARPTDPGLVAQVLSTGARTADLIEGGIGGTIDLSPEDTESVLVTAWGNPPGNETLGMLLKGPEDILADESWAVVIAYEEDGYVSDENADSIDYAEMLSDMQESSRESNEARVEAGYDEVELVGWAATPRYDKAANKLYWAKELRFGSIDVNTLNYNVRILGRKGVLVLNLVATMPQLQEIETVIPTGEWHHIGVNVAQRGDDLVARAVASAPGGEYGALILVMIVMFLLGFFLDFIEITFVIVPLVAPPLLAMGMDPIWLGILMALNLQTSFLTPPFGFALFYLRGVAPPEVTTTALYKGVLPFIGIQIFVILLVAFVPQIATTLPSMMAN